MRRKVHSIHLIRKFIEVIISLFLDSGIVGGLWNEFSKVINLWMIKDYAYKKGQYAKLWNEGVEVIMLAMIKFEPNRNQFAKLLRFERYIILN